MSDPEKMVVLAVSPRLAKIVKMAMIVESEGPRSDDRDEWEIEAIESVITEIDSQMGALAK